MTRRDARQNNIMPEQTRREPPGNTVSNIKQSANNRVTIKVTYPRLMAEANEHATPLNRQRLRVKVTGLFGPDACVARL